MNKRTKKKSPKFRQIAAGNTYNLLINEPAYACHVEKMHQHVKAKKYRAAARQINKAQEKGFAHYQYTMVQSDELCDFMGKRTRRSQSVWTVRT